MKQWRWGVAIAAAALVVVSLLARARRRPHAVEPETPAIAVAAPPAASEPPGRTRRLVEENFALRREAELLRRALDGASTPQVHGLPAPPAPVGSADENRIMDDIGKRVTDELRPRMGQLYHELTGAAPAPDASFEALLSALLEAAGVKDYQALFAEITALKSVYRRHGAPPPSATAPQRILWLLQDADEAMEAELREALPPDRVQELQKRQSGFGFSISRRNGRWEVTQSRPHA
jgi:hypothetical protein